MHPELISILELTKRCQGASLANAAQMYSRFLGEKGVLGKTALCGEEHPVTRRMELQHKQNIEKFGRSEQYSRKLWLAQEDAIPWKLKKPPSSDSHELY